MLIEDTGVGREKSMQINKMMRKDHESHATKATISRIELINKSTEFEWSITTVDLPRGTRVVINQNRR